MYQHEQLPHDWSPSARNDERIRRRQSRYHCDIDGFPFAALFLVILFIVMTYLPRLHFDRAPVDLAPSSRSVTVPSAMRDDSLNVAVSAGGSVYFRGRRIAPADLPGKIRDGLESGAERRIYLYVDSRTFYADVKQVLDEIRAAGITNVTFITQ